MVVKVDHTDLRVKWHCHRRDIAVASIISRGIKSSIFCHGTVLFSATSDVGTRAEEIFSLPATRPRCPWNCSLAKRKVMKKETKWWIVAVKVGRQTRELGPSAVVLIGATLLHGVAVESDRRQRLPCSGEGQQACTDNNGCGCYEVLM